jgi:ABC-type Fe3+ transport system permease subunit
VLLPSVTIVLLPFSVPGTVIALGVILMWSGKFGVNLYNTATRSRKPRAPAGPVTGRP